jgi:hypothetical protein
MATTFDGLVNLAPVDEGTTYLVNDLTGLSQEMADSLTREGDNEDLEALWIRIKANALEKLTIDFEVMMAEKRDFRHELCQTIHPTPNPKLAFETYDDYVGALLEVQYNELTAVKLLQLVMWAETSGTAQITVWDDTLRKELLAPIDKALIAGINRIEIGLDAISLDFAGLSVFAGLKTTVKLRPMTVNKGFRGAVCGIAVVYSAQLDPEEDECAEVKGTTWPVHLSAKVIGDIAALVVNHREKLAPAFRYLCGHLLLKERLASDNFNGFTNTNQLKMEELRDDYQMQYKSHLTKAIKTVYTNLEDSEVTGTNTEHQGGWFMGSYV